MLANGHFEEENGWHEAWVPFLEDGGGNSLCVDLKGVDGPAGQIIEFWHEESDRPFRYGSIDEWLEHFLGKLEAGEWEVDKDGSLFWEE